MKIFQPSAALGLLLILVVAGCGFGNRSGGSIFDSNDNRNDNRCSYDNNRYAQGTTICRSGREVRCNAGRWKDLGEKCADNATARCTFNGASYASGKATCQSGKRFRCEDGAWRNTGNSCKG